MAERYSTDGVQALADEFIRFKRYVEDALENLDVNNFADGAWKKMVTKFGDVSSAGFEAYADAEKAIARMFAEYKTEINKSIASVEAVADANGASITQLVTWQGNVDTSINDLQLRDSTLAESISKIEQTANGNGATIASLVAWKGDAQKSAASIEQAADTNGAFINLLAYSGNKNIDTSKGYYYDEGNDEYVFYDSKNNEIRISSYEFAGIYIEAMNNGATSALTSVHLNANVIEFGEYASVDSLGNFYATRIFGRGVSDIGEYPGAYFADITSTMAGSTTGEPVGGDFCIRKVPGYSDGIIRDDEDLVYGLMFDKTSGEDAYSVNFVVGSSLNYGGHSVWGYNYGQGKFYPKGTWDFSVCSVDGLGLVPVFG